MSSPVLCTYQLSVTLGVIYADVLALRPNVALIQATNKLRHAAGNVYYNEKCTGAVVGRSQEKGQTEEHVGLARVGGE